MPHVPTSDAARARAVKRHLWAEPQRFVATCALGVEPLLEAEVARLPGVTAAAPRPGGVTFDAPFDTLYTALLTLRTAESLRVVLTTNVAASTYPMLHDQLTRIRWSLWLPPRCDAQVRVVSRASRLRDDDGLAHALRGALRHHGVEPSIEGAPAVTLHLRLERDRATVALDLGGPLYRRSGDKWVSRATVRETTAAALVTLADVHAADLLLDPCCGSGTLLQEALEARSGLPAGRRRSPPFEASPAWKPERARHALRSATPDDPATPPPAVGRDADERAVAVARRNLEQAGWRGRVDLAVARAETLDLAAEARSQGASAPLLLSNPPYGKRAAAAGGSPDDLVAALLRSAAGWRFALLYPDVDAIARVPGVEVTRSERVVTGGLRNAIVVGRVRA